MASPSQRSGNEGQNTATNVPAARRMPGTRERTLGQLLQDREAALHEILLFRERPGPEFPAAHHREDRQRRGLAESGALGPRAAAAAGTLLRRKEVSELLGISASTLCARVAQGTFPAQVRIGPRSVRWRHEDVIALAERTTLLSLGAPEIDTARPSER